MSFRTILADPPWDYANWTDTVHGAATSAMVTMTMEDICAIPVASWAADDAVLACWATWPKLADALRVIEAWEFKYITGIPWIKTLPSAQASLFAEMTAEPIRVRRGIGFWFQSTSELLLFARRGMCSPGRTAQLGLLTLSRRQFYAPIGRHSAKPEGIQDYLERHFDGARLELFARRGRPGWTCWGYDVGYELGPWGVRPVEAIAGGDSDGKRAKR